ncbi:recombinase RecA [Paramixta manurensis]|uniref:Protein RecA n=1 Tax=Paramixta manurensis TaxID=2740817 RepID=A0A6M8UEM4_9GAMM|nr:recombinase RecA [Erwiniaceae bacterium PD-1]
MAENHKVMLDTSVSLLEQKFGKGIVYAATKGNQCKQLVSIPTGCMGLDRALDIGGLPLGRIVEIFGPDSSGKTTLALSVIRQAQQLGKSCAFIDSDRALHTAYAENSGIDLDRLLVSRPATGELALDVCESIIRSRAASVIVIDSVAALITRGEYEGAMGDAHDGEIARLMSKAMRKLSPLAHQYNCLLIFINQIRNRPGVIYGNPEVTTGGAALKQFASIRLDVRQTNQLAENKTVVATEHRVKVVKNKMGSPYRQATFQIWFDHGISHEGEVLDHAMQKGIVLRSGVWYRYGEFTLGNNKTSAICALMQHKEIREKLEREVNIIFKSEDLHS